jgi:Ca2+-transporting ATPase
MVLAIFGFAMYRGRGEAEARALSFTTLIVANLGLILTNRSWSRSILEILRSPNSAQWFVLGGAAAFMGLVLTIPFLRDLFRFDRLHPDDILLCIAAGATSVLWFEGLKLFRARALQKTTRRAAETS